jgi:hypothetical protein
MQKLPKLLEWSNPLKTFEGGGGGFVGGEGWGMLM